MVCKGKGLVTALGTLLETAHQAASSGGIFWDVDKLCVENGLGPSTACILVIYSHHLPAGFEPESRGYKPHNLTISLK